MPEIDGITFLDKIKDIPIIRRILIIISSFSDYPTHVYKCYDLFENPYAVKPGDNDGHIRMVNITVAYWLKMQQIPRLHRPRKTENYSFLDRDLITNE